jgi:hypothetical protein
MFDIKAGAYLIESELLRCSTLGWAPAFTHIHWTRLERPARDKIYRSLRIFVNYSSEIFYDIGPRFHNFWSKIILMTKMFLPMKY